MRDAAEKKPRKPKPLYRRHDKHKSAAGWGALDPEIQKAIEELPAWLQRHAHRANLH